MRWILPLVLDQNPRAWFNFDSLLILEAKLLYHYLNIQKIKKKRKNIRLKI